MKEEIKLHIENKEELLDALNNAIVALNEVKNKFFLGAINLNNQWETWLQKHNNNIDECVELLTRRLEILNDVYNQLDK